jgi:hypothetical protein
MREILRQVVTNLRANKLRSFLTMFGILWGVISVVILQATGEGSAAATTRSCGSSGRTSRLCGAHAPGCRRAASAPAATSA